MDRFEPTQCIEREMVSKLRTNTEFDCPLSVGALEFLRVISSQ